MGRVGAAVSYEYSYQSSHEHALPGRRAAVGRSVAIVGAGGIGFDVAEFLAHG